MFTHSTHTQQSGLRILKRFMVQAAVYLVTKNHTRGTSCASFSSESWASLVSLSELTLDLYIFFVVFFWGSFEAEEFFSPRMTVTGGVGKRCCAKLKLVFRNTRFSPSWHPNVTQQALLRLCVRHSFLSFTVEAKWSRIWYLFVF